MLCVCVRDVTQEQERNYRNQAIRELIFVDLVRSDEEVNLDF